MSILDYVSSLITTKGRKIQIKQGLSKDFRDEVLDVGEFGLLLDTHELRIGLSDGTTMTVNGDSSAQQDITSHKNLVATTVTLGHVKVGENINIDTDGTISISNATDTEKGIVQLVDDLETDDNTKALSAKQGKELKELIDNIEIVGGGSIADIPTASSTSNGLMTSEMVNKLNSISSGANFTTVENSLTSTSTTSALSAYQGKVLNDKIDNLVVNAPTVVDASVNNKGIVQLSDSVSSTSLVQAATANSVKKAYDLANSKGNVKSDGSVNLQNLTVGSRNSSDNIGSRSFVQGYNCTASNENSSAMGIYAKSTGYNSHSIGSYVEASGQDAMAIGSSTTASGNNAYSEGFNTQSIGECSHSQGHGTISYAYASHAMGKFNKSKTGFDKSFSTNGDILIIGNGYDSSSRSNSFRVTNDGKVYGLSSFNSSGADYAEYFEWKDGNTKNEDRVGYIVTLDESKIRKAKSTDEYILGIISGDPSVIGDSHQDDWSERYLKDEWGRKIIEEYIDEKGNKCTRFKLNPNWNPNEEYIPREQRKEWDAVGLVGKLLVRDDGTSEVNGYVKVGSKQGIATKSDSPTNMRVMERVSDNIIRVFVK